MDDITTDVKLPGRDLKPAGRPAAKPEAGKKEQYDVFISYRRSGGSELATLIESSLRSRGYRVFLDVRRMPPGPFDESLVRIVKLATDVVIVLTPGSLDRSANQTDWFFEEIALALQTRKNVVPFRQQQYKLPSPESLPEPLRPIIRHHSATYIHGRTDSSFDELCRLLRSRPRRKMFLRAMLLGIFVAVIVTAAVLALVPWHPSKSSPPKLEVFQMIDGARTPLEGPALLPKALLKLVPHVADGMLPYILEVKGDGTAELFAPDQMTKANWEMQIDVPHTSETILLLASDHKIADAEKHQIEKSITDLALKPRVAIATQSEWSPDGVRPVKTMEGSRGLPDVVDSDWQGRLLSSLQSLKGVSFGGVSLPILNTADTDQSRK